MPNWCSNKLYVQGSEEEVNLFREKANGPIQSYNEFMDAGRNAWAIHDDIRLKALIASVPDLGDCADFSFHALYPVPEDFRRFPYDDKRAKEVGEKVGENRPYGGYAWESNHWGVKWGGCQSSLESNGEGYLEYVFETPWGPPIEFFEKISQDWKTLTFELCYEEPGHGFKGQAIWSGGECVSEEYNEFQQEDWDNE